MMRAVGAKAVASVEMVVPPAMVAGELNVEPDTSEGETREEDLCLTAIIRTSTTNHTEWFNQASTRGNAGKQSSKI